MDSEAQKEYDSFIEKTKRTVYLDNLSPLVTSSVIRTALNQFGSVANVQFIPNYLEGSNIPRCALVEMENAEQARGIISVMSNYPFMMSGMPRPVRARAANLKMFENRPVKPGRKIQIRWLDPQDPDFEVAKKLKLMTRKHAAEASFLLKLQLEEEEKLAKKQAESLKANYQKFEMMDNVLTDGTAHRLAREYNISLKDAD